MNEFETMSYHEINMLIGVIVFTIVMAAFLFKLMERFRQWNFNNNEPLGSVSAIVKAKRTRIDGGSNDTTRTDYFITFELKNGDRKEFKVKPEEFGVLVEEDKGTLEYQGTRYVGFALKKDRSKL
ncbi:DUF2500 domain-containing protein [Bacillus sp. NEB1478]|uniref:DUF2500 domain-containing protein n=1 Tax=Bacillus sp. NEB1478 TaxID=3073816 RepID=UPI002872C40D|nr:DUF2500 domain-containing protein [Bacillus sp. NEB1478]WNB91248.1 DUF2500 domain-containing protein [Bacillus sp. NEB1478]